MRQRRSTLRGARGEVWDRGVDKLYFPWNRNTFKSETRQGNLRKVILRSKIAPPTLSWIKDSPPFPGSMTNDHPHGVHRFLTDFVDSVDSLMEKENNSDHIVATQKFSIGLAGGGGCEANGWGRTMRQLVFFLFLQAINKNKIFGSS
jgi:hypothetical protein